METELKNCPFCGKEAYLRDDIFIEGLYAIHCTNEDCFAKTIDWTNKKELVEAWNKRVK